MNNIAYPHIKFINFSDLFLWDFKRYASNNISSTKYKVVKLSDYIHEENLKIKPFENPEEEYEILGVNNKTGLFDAYIEKGSKINQPYKIVKNGFLAYNPYRVNVGSIGLKTEQQKYKYISPAYVVFSCKKGLLPDFLYILFRTNKFNELIRENTTGSVRQTLSFTSMGNIKIPLPSIDIQKDFVKRYNEKIKLAEEQEFKALQLENDIEQFLFSELDVDKQTKENEIQNKNLLSFTDLKKLSRWGVEYLKTQKSDNTLLKSRTIPMKKLGSILEIDPKNNFSALNEDLEMSFIPMQCISDENGEIIKLENGINKKSKGYTRFKEGDLIWAKITPCMQNGKSAILKGLKNGYGYGSTEFYVIRNLNSNICLDYIYHILRTKLVRQDAVKYFTGSSGQQRVPKSYLQNLEIPLPDFDKQKNISNQIYTIKMEIKNLKQEAEQNRITAQEEFEKELFE